MKVVKAYGINVQASRMFPCSEEISEVLTVCHGGGAVVLGFNYLASAKSQKPWLKDISMAIKSGRNDACVCVGKPKVLAFAQNTRDEVRILGEDGQVSGCLNAETGSHQQTYLCVRRRRRKLSRGGTTYV